MKTSRSSNPRVVLATVGHNEAEYLRATLRGLLAAARPGDEVWFVDSGSTDHSTEIASEMGVSILMGPVGKGAAMEAAISEIPFTGWVVFLDGDAGAESQRIALALRRALEGAEPEMIVGQFWSSSPSLLPSTHGVYAPLVDALFPEVNDRFGTRPLSGFRALSRRIDWGLPAGFGVEAFLNLSVVLRGLSTGIVDIGAFSNPFRFKPQMPLEISTAILDIAQAEGRLSGSDRLAWEEWIGELVEPLEQYRGEAPQRPEVAAHIQRCLAGPRPT